VLTGPNTEKQVMPASDNTTRPDAHPAKNVRRAGAPNTQQSGETTMVGTHPNSRPESNGPLDTWVSEKITAQSHRFLSLDDRGRLTVALDRLAVLVAEMISEHTADLCAQLDAANDAVVDLLDQRDTAELALGRALHDVEAGGRGA
jgi:hypothetical protein